MHHRPHLFAKPFAKEAWPDVETLHWIRGERLMTTSDDHVCDISSCEGIAQSVEEEEDIQFMMAVAADLVSAALVK